MQQHLWIFITLILMSSSALAQLSSQRAPGEDYLIARNRHVGAQIAGDYIGREGSVERTKRPLTDWDLTEIPALPSYAALEAEFKYIRDTRFLTTYDLDFPRRLSWLYPDDGCYARAELSKNKLIEHSAPAPWKVFVFGNLSANTPNTFTGVVNWWYHVAVTYRVQDEIYVFDPSIEPHRPMTLSQWNFAVGGENRLVHYAFCAANAYDPTSNCTDPREIPLPALLSEQHRFLRPEWDRIKRLNRDPQRELGESPPWLR